MEQKSKLENQKMDRYGFVRNKNNLWFETKTKIEPSINLSRHERGTSWHDVKLDVISL